MINPLHFNFIYQKTQNRVVNTPLRMNNGLQADTVSFSGVKEKTLEDLVPTNKGIIYKKVKDKNGNIKKVPQEVDIVKNGPDKFQFKIDGESVGSVWLSHIKKSENEGNTDDVCCDYPNEGVVGDRIVVNYVYNAKQEEYGGIAHLGDLIAVAACKELGFEPNVVSKSLEDAAPFHYVRGKRFIPFKEYHNDYYDFYDNREPDEIVKGILESTPKGEKFDALEIEHEFLTYMPKEMITKLEEELKEHPIF